MESKALALGKQVKAEALNSNRQEYKIYLVRARHKINLVLHLSFEYFLQNWSGWHWVRIV
jgi:hypothetical protein